MGLIDEATTNQLRERLAGPAAPVEMPLSRNAAGYRWRQRFEDSCAAAPISDGSIDGRLLKEV